MIGQPRRGGLVVVRAHERVHVTIATFEQAAEQLLAYEAGRAGEQQIPHQEYVPSTARLKRAE